MAAPNAENGKNSLVDGEIIELDSDEEMPDVSADFQSWYSDYLRQLEHQYPAAFDNTIKDALQSNEKGSKNRNHALKMALGIYAAIALIYKTVIYL